MDKAPEIATSTMEERRQYVKKRFPCLSDCDMCGLCKVFREKDAESAYHDYITGSRTFTEVSRDYR